MNNDLISRSELKKKFGYTDEWYKSRTVAQEIDNAPTVELTEEQAIDKLHETGWLIRHDKEMTERPQGEWIRLSARLYKCKNCGYIADAKYPFCHCGADMRGVRNETDN